MNSLNTAQVIGNLTRDPEMKSTQSGQPITTIGVATNRYWTDSNGQKKDEAEYHNVVMWGRLAEIAHQYLRKGMKVFFQGRLQTRSWEDDAGIKHFRTEIVARDMIILSPKGEVANEELAVATGKSEDNQEGILLSEDDIDI